jgi:hypothetical protein
MVSGQELDHKFLILKLIRQALKYAIKHQNNRSPTEASNNIILYYHLHKHHTTTIVGSDHSKTTDHQQVVILLLLKKATNHQQNHQQTQIIYEMFWFRSLSFPKIQIQTHKLLQHEV